MAKWDARQKVFNSTTGFLALLRSKVPSGDEDSFEHSVPALALWDV